MFRSLLIGLVLAGVPTTLGVAAASSEEHTIAAYEMVSKSVVSVVCRGLDTDAEDNYSEVMSTGSGFAISEGLVVTNYHVIANALEITLFTQAGQSSIASVVGTAPDFDLALLRAPFNSTELPVAAVGNPHTIRIGQKILAVGSPFGLENSVTAGIVSGLHRDIRHLAIGPHLIQFDAPINPGHSGGPLIDSSGRTIGVILAKVRDGEAVGFAIPVDIAVDLVPDLIRMGHRFRPQIGMQGIDVSTELATLFGLGIEAGFLIESVESGSPADVAGLKNGERLIELGDHIFVLGGDIIVEIDGQPITGAADVAEHLNSSRPGTVLTISIYRDGSVRDIRLVILPMNH